MRRAGRKRNRIIYQAPVDEPGRTIADVLREHRRRHYLHGTPNGIRVDPDSGLIWSPAHFTWMDTNYPAGTPREGYPVEIQALWIRLLRRRPNSRQAGGTKRGATWPSRAAASLEKLFWLDAPGWYADVLLGVRGSLRATPRSATPCAATDCS